MPDSTASIDDFPASDSEPAPPPCRLSRTEQVARLSRATPGLAQRKQAKQLGVSRGRLRHWRHRKKSNGAPLQEVAFFESPVDLDRAQQHREQARQEVRSLGDAYHPYLPETGQAQTPVQLQARMETSWANLERIAREAPLTERCRQLLGKAKRLTQAMLPTLQFFIATCRPRWRR